MIALGYRKKEIRSLLQKGVIIGRPQKLEKYFSHICLKQSSFVPSALFRYKSKEKKRPWNTSNN